MCGELLVEEEAKSRGLAGGTDGPRAEPRSKDDTAEDDSAAADDQKCKLVSQEPVGGDNGGAQSSKFKRVRFADDGAKTHPRGPPMLILESWNPRLLWMLKKRSAQQERRRVAWVKQWRDEKNGCGMVSAEKTGLS